MNTSSRSRPIQSSYERRTRPPPRELDAKNTAAAFALEKAKHEFATKQFEEEMAKRSPLRKVFGGVVETLNLARAVMTSVDLSAVLRQGGFISYGHPLRAAKSIMPMLRAFASEKAAFAANAEIESRPNHRLYKQSGLDLTESHGYKLSAIEEQFQSRWLDKVPAWLGGGIVRGSSRAFVTFLNKLRADSFDAMVAALALRDTPTIEEAKAIANYINIATGRGKIGSRGQTATGLNTIFFAPRLVASRFNLLFGQPMYAGTLRTRALVAKEYARFMMGVGMVFALAVVAKMAFGDDDDDEPLTSMDPRSADFLKLKFGNTYIDPLAGISQVTVFLAREATGEKVTGADRLVPIRAKYRLNDARVQLNEWMPAVFEYPGYLPDMVPYGGDSGFDVAARFARTKMAPAPGAIMNILSGTDVVGNPVEVDAQVVQMVTPMSLQNVKEIMTEHGVAGGTAIQLLNMLGMGVQYRDPNR